MIRRFLFALVLAVAAVLMLQPMEAGAQNSCAYADPGEEDPCSALPGIGEGGPMPGNKTPGSVSGHGSPHTSGGNNTSSDPPAPDPPYTPASEDAPLISIWLTW